MATRSDADSIAEQLFVRSWRAGSPVAGWKVASDCYAAALEFLKVSAMVREGVAPSDIAEQFASRESP